MSLSRAPDEVIQNIASHLSDQDLASLRASCRAARAAIDAHPYHFWMYRFREHFDMPRYPCSLEDLRDIYQARRKALRSAPHFGTGRTAQENECMKQLIDIALDANPVSINEYGVPDCKNFEVLDRFILTTNILQSIFQRIMFNGKAVTFKYGRKISKKARNASGFDNRNVTTMQLFQLIMTPRCLSFFIPYPRVYSFPASQRAVYMDLVSAPLFGGKYGLEVNIEWALHVVNFFRFHVLGRTPATLYSAFSDLDEKYEGTEMPQMWKQRLSSNAGTTPLGTHWKGSYSYISELDIKELRLDKFFGNRVYEDHNVDLGKKGIQELEMNFPGRPTVWPEIFEKHLHGDSFIEGAFRKAYIEWNGPFAMRNTRSTVPSFLGPLDAQQLKSVYFDAHGWDDENFWGSGFINMLPTQMGIPGFKRIVMMKYFPDSNNQIDMSALWAYEGVVLPGDQIIVGRWWSPNTPIDRSKVYSGPFIFWNTDCGAKYQQAQVQAVLAKSKATKDDSDTSSSSYS
ncbi:hypothetical protein, variant [Verruconis gallopava]|uniref:F-box domain-containing protein n=1 Tax=Verruconis gallopava TaxID=253628 RepID=A0A0D2B6Z5_9PEZI|nr:uncharacterized protein PV09_02642 [Verruconis gallopava]XP_016216853.1 hypothetical protein, variant [Verruconis gallopava]KIW06983.1 hypothetical protein PV09_02642 [Verruconis gallopava]KIW06984.1 hypothetical protein, variant [Verruconis gallopava]